MTYLLIDHMTPQSAVDALSHTNPIICKHVTIYILSSSRCMTSDSLIFRYWILSTDHYLVCAQTDSLFKR